MKILVTGANGYIGQGVVKLLLDDGYDVLATDYKIENIDSRAKRIKCDLFSVDNPFMFFDQPDVLLHLAWKNGFQHFSNSHIDDLPKHSNFLNSMATNGIKKIAVMGSMHEIGFFEGCINEDTPCHPVTPYGISKNALRQLASLFCLQNGVEFQWLRGYYIVGNSEYGSSIFSKITKAEKHGDTLFPFTMGQNQYDFIDYESFCHQVANAVTQDEILGVIEICSGYPEKLADRVESYIKDNNYKISLDYGAFQDRPYDSKAIWGNNKKIQMIMRNR